MADPILNAYANVPTGTVAGLKINGGNEYADVNEHVADADTATSAVILTYTPPTGKTAVVTGISAFETAGASTQVLDIRLNNGTTTLVLYQLGAGIDEYRSVDIALEDGHSLEIFVSTVSVAGTEDVAFFIKEQV